LLIITGSTTSGKRSPSLFGNQPEDFIVAQAPVLAAAAAGLEHGLELAGHQIGRDRSTC